MCVISAGPTRPRFLAAYALITTPPVDRHCSMCAQPYTSSINASTTWPRAVFASSCVITGWMRSTSRVREPLSESHRRYKPHHRTADYMIVQLSPRGIYVLFAWNKIRRRFLPWQRWRYIIPRIENDIRCLMRFHYSLFFFLCNKDITENENYCYI